MNAKVLRIIARLNIGGPARNAVLLTEGLHNKGFETILLCGEVSESEGDMMYLIREKGIEPIIVKELGRELSIRNDWRTFWNIYRIICREKPDIIHTHTAKAGTLGRLAGVLYNFFFALTTKRKEKRIILVHTFHGHVLHSYFGTIKTFFFIWIERILALFTDRVVTVGESLKKELVEKFKIAQEKKFSVIELGFNLSELLKLHARENSDCINIGIIGRLVPVKNHRMLFRVAKGVKDKGLKVKFLIIGDGKLSQELKDYAKELNIEDMVEFKGWIKDLHGIYKELDIVALTSLNEGTPVSIIEAMAAARPVVAAKVGGVSDIVEDNKSGYLIGPKDDENFSKKLQDLIDDRNKRERFGEYAREVAKNRFLKERLINDIDRLYNTLLSNRRRVL